MPYTEVVARRLRRIYLPFLFLMLAAWGFKITAFNPRPWIDVAAVGGIPGPAVIVILAAYYLTAVAITFWPRERQSKGEFSRREYGEWKKTN